VGPEEKKTGKNTKKDQRWRKIEIKGGGGLAKSNNKSSSITNLGGAHKDQKGDIRDEPLHSIRMIVAEKLMDWSCGTGISGKTWGEKQK